MGLFSAKSKTKFEAKSDKFRQGKEFDPYIHHANQLISQVLFRVNLYRLARDDCHKQDSVRFIEPVKYATVSATIVSFLIAAGVFTRSKEQQVYAALFGGFCGIFATTMNAFRSAENLNVKVNTFP